MQVGYTGGAHTPADGVGHRERDPAIQAQGGSALSCGRHAQDCSLALGPCSFGSLCNLIKGLYVPACTPGPGLETKGMAWS